MWRACVPNYDALLKIAGEACGYDLPSYLPLKSLSGLSEYFHIISLGKKNTEKIQNGKNPPSSLKIGGIF